MNRILLRYNHLPLFSPEAPGGAPTPAPAAPAPSAPAPASQPEPAAVPSSEPSTNSSLIPADVLSIFEHDPFAQGAPAPAEPAAPAPVADNQPTPAAPPTPAPTPAPGPDLATLQSQIGLLTEHALRQPAPAPAGQPQAPDVPLPPHAYGFTVPDELVAAMASDNPLERKQALGAMIQGTAQNIHREVVRHMRGEIMRAVPVLINQAITQSSAAQAVAQDFYGTYPEFNRPELKQLVGTIGPQVAQRMGVPQGQWTPALRDAIATEVRNLIASVSGARPVATPQPQPQMPPVFSGGARPAPAPVNDIEATLFGT